MSYRTGFRFDDRIYWTFLRLVTAFSQITISTTDHTVLIHSSNWVMLSIRRLWSVTSWLPPIPAIPSIFPPSLTLYPLIGQLSSDFLPSYACLGRKEQLSLGSLKEYPLGTGRLLANGEPISKFGFDLGLFRNYFLSKVHRWFAGSRLPAIASRWGWERLRWA
jgi:hypothetical protein